MKNATTRICPRHGGSWGDDDQCPECTWLDGEPKPNPEEPFTAASAPPEIVIRIRCDDGSDGDLFVTPPKGWGTLRALRVIEKRIDKYFASSGEKELIPALQKRGFGFPDIIDTESTW